MPQAQISKLSSDIETLQTTTSSISKKIDRIEDEADDLKIDVKLLAKEVQDLTVAVRQNNKILNGSSKSSILIRMALIESSQAYLVDRLIKLKDETRKSNSAKYQLIGVTIAASLSFAGTIILGWLNYSR